MNSDQLDDLKQFIAASVSQSEERLKNETGLLERGLRHEMSEGFKTVRQEMKQEFQAVRQEMADGFRGVGEAVDTIHKQLDDQNGINAAVDKRLAKLEHQVAK